MRGSCATALQDTVAQAKLSWFKQAPFVVRIFPAHISELG